MKMRWRGRTRSAKWWSRSGCRRGWPTRTSASSRTTARLSAEDRATLLGWIDQGCPKGDPADLPPAKEFAEGWTIGKPDEVFTMPDEFTVPATADEKGLKYQYFVVRTKFDEDRWVQAAEAKPGNRAVVHHIIVYVVKPGKDGGFMRGKTADGIGDGFLTAYAPGELASALPAGSAKRVPKNSLLVFQMHYTPNGVEQNDRSSVGLIFAKEPPKIEVRTRAVAQKHLNIPPGEANYEAKSETVFDRDADLLSLLPHMHLRGKDFRYQVVYPDGTPRDAAVGAALRFQLAEQLPPGKAAATCRPARGSNAPPTTTTRRTIRTIPIRINRCAGATRPGTR